MNCVYIVGLSEIVFGNEWFLKSRINVQGTIFITVSVSWNFNQKAVL